MAVRNFYVEANIDGRQNTLGGGPKSKEGEMSVRLYQRKEGEISEALMIDCEVHGDKLVTKIYDSNHNVIFTYETER